MLATKTVKTVITTARVTGGSSICKFGAFKIGKNTAACIAA